MVRSKPVRSDQRMVDDGDADIKEYVEALEMMARRPSWNTSPFRGPDAPHSPAPSPL
jgi:hypothetical protein